MFAFVVWVMMLVPCAFSQQASVSPSSLNFGAQVITAVSTGSQGKTISITNSGTADLVVSSISASGGYEQTNNCRNVSSHAACTIEVTFKPGTTGTLNGAITINDNTPSSPQIVSL